jgi:hypothetical protein
VSRHVRRPAFSRSAKAAASLIFVVLVAASCSSDGFPESYTDQVQTLDNGTEVSLVEMNWLEGCTVGLADSDLANDANNICACSYAEVSGPDGIAFDEFVDLNNELKGDPNALGTEESMTPAERRLLDIVRGCIAGS